MPDTALDSRALPPDPRLAEAAPDQAALLFGTDDAPPLWLWLALERDELDALEAALIAHLRSPLFPSRIGEAALRVGAPTGLLEFARGFGPMAARFAGGTDLVIAAFRIVAERGGPAAREAALGCVEALLHRLHAEARALGAGATQGVRLRHFVLASRLAADLWLRHVPGPDGARALSARLAETLNLTAAITLPDPPPAPAATEATAPPAGITLLQPFDAPNDRTDWDGYRALTAPLPLRAVPRDALARLAALARQAPGFAAPLAELRRGLALALHAGRPAPRLRPILLVGPPGIGKTWFARRLAQALDLPFGSLNLGGATDNRCLQGTARGWSAATPAWPVGELARLRAPNPVLFLDELDKAGGQRESNGRAHDTLLAMIEPESAAHWFDECLRSAADLRHILWVMAANDTRGIAAPLLSRLSVHHIEAPGAAAFGAVLAGLLEGTAEALGCPAADLPALPPETLAALRRSFAGHRNLRRLRAQVEDCLGLAAEAALAATH